MRSSKLIFITTGTLLLTLTNLATGNAQIVVETLSAGEQIGVEVAMSSDPVTTTSTEHVAIPNASLSWTTRESVLIEVTLTGECRLIGGNLPGEWIEVYANISSSRPVDGFPKVLDPGSDIGSPMAFCSDDLWEAHSASWATLVPAARGPGGPVTYTVEIFWRTNVDGNTAWLDDWKLSLHVSRKPE